MTSITFAIAAVLSLAFTPVSARGTNCDDWMSSDREVLEQFWEATTVETLADCLNAGANVNARDEIGRTPLHFAAESNKNSAVLAVLLGAGANINARSNFGGTSLHSAAFANENPDAITLLVGAGADVNARNKSGNTPLHYAAKHNKNPEVASVLVEVGADVNVRNNDGIAPIFTAIVYFKRQPGLLTMLLEAGADVNSRSPNGSTPIHSASGGPLAEQILPRLLEFGPDVNSRDKDGNTPLHSAAYNIYFNHRSDDFMIEGLRLLLEAGADGSAVDNYGATPFDIIKDNEAIAGTNAYWVLHDARFD